MLDKTFFLWTLFILGTLFGSFASVLIYRFKSWEKWIIQGRSHCKKCDRILSALELIPVISWLIQGWKCKVCKQKISALYPFLEISTGLLFAGVWYFLFGDIPHTFWEYFSLILWLNVAFVSVLYVFYDILFLEIHEWIMLSGVVLAGVTLIGESFFPGIFLPWMQSSTAGGILFQIILLLIIIGGLYTIILKELHEAYDILILLALWCMLYFSKGILEGPIIGGIFGAMIFFTFFFIQIVISKGKWMGGGDLRIGIMVGMILGISMSLPGMMLTYFSGSIIGLGVIGYQKIFTKKKTVDTQVPFGPFLATWMFLSVCYWQEIQLFIDTFFIY